MKMSEEVNELFTGMFKLKGKLKQPKFDASVDYTTREGKRIKFDYATLRAIEEAVRTAAQESESGIDFQQEVTNENNTLTVTTIIYHISGQWIQHGPFVFPNSGTNPQGLGSLTTYARRYALAAAFGIAADKDDDAQTADDNQQQTKQTQNQPPQVINEKQLNELKAHANACAEVGGHPPEVYLEEIAKMGHVSSVEELLSENFMPAKAELIKWRQNFIEEQKKKEARKNDIPWGRS